MALLAALLMAIYPPAVLYSRLGFSYNLLAPLVLITWRGLVEYWQLSRSGFAQRPRWLSTSHPIAVANRSYVARVRLALACSAVGLGLLCDLWMGVLIAPVLAVVFLCNWRDAWWASLLMALPLMLYAVSQLSLVPQAFLFDVHFTLARLNAIPFTQQAATLLDNIATLFNQDKWWLVGLVGLAALKPGPVRNLSLFFLLWPIAILGRTVALYSLSFYYMIPLLPLIVLGVAVLIHTLAKYQRLLALAAMMLALVFFPASLRQLYSGFVTPIDDFLINPEDARAAAQFVNQHSQANDVIIASPAVAWLLQSNVADFQMAVAATGEATVHLPANLPVNRFAFDPRYPTARYIIVDNLWRNWAAVHMPAVAEMIQTVAAWPMAFQAGEISVYQNPTLIR
jgi:hypothetical protein